MKTSKRTARILVTVLAVVMVFAFSTTAFAIGSPTGSTVVGTSDNVQDVAVSALSEGQDKVLGDAADSHVATKYGSDYTATTLLSMDLNVTLKDGQSGPVDITLNVAGVKTGDTIIVAHQKSDNSVEFLDAAVVSNGVVKFTMTDFSPISIIRVAQGGAGGTDDPVYKTGDSTSAITMVLLIVMCGVVALTCGRALKRAR